MQKNDFYPAYADRLLA